MRIPNRLFELVSTQDEFKGLKNNEAKESNPNPLESAVLNHSKETVAELVAHVAKEEKLGAEKATRGLARALEDGVVQLVDPNPPKGLAGYFTSLYALWFWLVAMFVALVLVSIYVLPQVYPLVYLRYVTGAVFILFMPGYVLIEALYPKADELRGLEKFALDVGLSLALVPIVGLVLNYLPGGIGLGSIIASLSVLVLALGVAGVCRKFEYFSMARQVLVKS